MASKQEAVKAADRLMAYFDAGGTIEKMDAQTRKDYLVAVSVLRSVASQSAMLRRQFCRRCRNAKCGPCIYRWVQGLIGERPPKLRGEDRA